MDQDEDENPLTESPEVDKRLAMFKKMRQDLQREESKTKEEHQKHKIDELNKKIEELEKTKREKEARARELEN